MSSSVFSLLVSVPNYFWGLCALALIYEQLSCIPSYLGVKLKSWQKMRMLWWGFLCCISPRGCMQFKWKNLLESLTWHFNWLFFQFHSFVRYQVLVDLGVPYSLFLIWTTLFQCFCDMIQIHQNRTKPQLNSYGGWKKSCIFLWIMGIRKISLNTTKFHRHLRGLLLLYFAFCTN